MIRIAFALAVMGAFCALFSFRAALDGRGRDALEGGVPAMLMLGGAFLAGRRALRQLRDLRDTLD